MNSMIYIILIRCTRKRSYKDRDKTMPCLKMMESPLATSHVSIVVAHAPDALDLGVPVVAVFVLILT